MMYYRLLFTVVSVLWLPMAAAAREPGSLPGPLKHTTSLKLQKGVYTSIFGLVPKRYTLESEERREILQKPEEGGGSLLELLTSETKRILSSPEEVPTVETGSKPLTGKSVRIKSAGESWAFEILGVESPNDSEKAEAARLLNRFQPGLSPFTRVNWSPEGTSELELESVLRFLGYPQVSAVHGSARLKRASDAVPEPWDLTVSAAFDSGADKAKVSVELEGKGTVTIAPETDKPKHILLEGRLVIHGQRDLPDGRNVPYTVEADFRYESASAPAP